MPQLKNKYFIGLLATALIASSLIVSLFISPDKPQANNIRSKTTVVNLDDSLALWKNGDYQQALEAIKHLAKDDPNAAFYHYYFSAYLDKNSAPLFKDDKVAHKKCSQTLLFVVGQVESLEQAEQFKQKFTADERLKRLPICIRPTLWFAPDKLACSSSEVAIMASEEATNQRISCDLGLLAEDLEEQYFTHLVMFAEQGKANVHNGIMYLDQQDDYNVFVHELAHFVGFVDEYPLNAGLASNVCSASNVPNLVFGSASGKDIDLAYWQGLELDLGTQLVKAKTCDNHPTQAYKMTDRLTFMEYHDVAYIPSTYLKIWRLLLQQPINSPSAHVNFAQYFEDRNMPHKSQVWRQKYHDYLSQ